MKRFILFVTLTLALLCLGGCSKKAALDADNPVTLTIWHVYGSQTKSPLNDSIDEFNRTVGNDKGVFINVVSVSSSSAIDQALTDSAKKLPGVPELPDLFTAYPRVAQIIGYDNLLNWEDYFSSSELEAFVPEFLEEGYFDDSLLMLPVAKSTELLFLNKTLFDKFSSDSGLEIEYESLSDYDTLFETCREYYDWSNGMDMFQINDFYHYFLTGVASFGDEFIVDGKPNADSVAFRKVWEPMARAGIYGGLCLGDGYASDRWKTGEVICNIGSTAGILYLRDYVTYSDNTTENVELSIPLFPHFKDGNPSVVHRGGGLFAMKSEDERKNEAAALFAKWLTSKENNIDFVTKTGYLPVTAESFDFLFDNLDTVENERYRLLYNSVKEMADDYTYCEIPVYDNASKVQSDFEKNVKDVLRAAHSEYLSRVENGEASQEVLEELVSSALSKFRTLYN